MTRSLLVGPEASKHIVEAFAWYEQQHAGLGTEFRTALTAVFDLLRHVPEAGPVVYRDLRRVLLRKFPYAVYYVLSPTQIVVRAVIHNRRHPRSWREGVNSSNDG
ncbi:MAG: type II toxin-antitoxin system RelE/ParE family toxin [Gemmatimonadales bacterium]